MKLLYWIDIIFYAIYKCIPKIKIVGTGKKRFLFMIKLGMMKHRLKGRKL